jgi:transcription initiation factor TFIID TATA-box-binding protein
LEKDGPAYTIYRTGSFQIRGAVDSAELDTALEKFRQVLREIDLCVEEDTFSQQTSVFLEDIRRDINLEMLAVQLGLEHTEYEPEQFPGLIYRPPSFVPTMLIFSSGNIIIAGTPDPEEATNALKHLLHEIMSIGHN